jgi:O-acetylserine/cysteine efflux transporter
VAEVGPSRTAVYNCLVPAVAMTLAWLSLGERPGPVPLLGAALILAGVLVARVIPTWSTA